MKGIFITIEGIDGSGKTTLAQILNSWLEMKGYSVVLTREPGGTPAGNQIRNIILNTPDIPPLAQLFLFLADRFIHVEQVIIPALQKGKIVICDRYFDSTVAYGGYGHGIDLDFIKKVNSVASKNTTPHLTILLDAPPQITLPRVLTKTIFESKGIEFYERVRKGYLKLAEEESDRIKVIDATQPLPLVFGKAQELIKELLHLP